jgi:hypothetical protein
VEAAVSADPKTVEAVARVIWRATEYGSWSTWTAEAEEILDGLLLLGWTPPKKEEPCDQGMDCEGYALHLTTGGSIRSCRRGSCKFAPRAQGAAESRITGEGRVG